MDQLISHNYIMAGDGARHSHGGGWEVKARAGLTAETADTFSLFTNIE